MRLHGNTLLTAGDVAKFFDVTRQAVLWMVRQGQLTSERTLSGQHLFRYGAVKEVLMRRGESRLQPTQRVRRPGGQLPLPIARAPQLPRKPESWWSARFRPRMVTATLESAPKAKQALVDRQANPRQIGGRSARVA